MRYFIAPRSGEKSYKNFQSTIKHGVSYSQISPFLTQEGKDILLKQEVIYSWGNREGKSSPWGRMQPRDIVIFYAKYNFVMAGEVVFKQQSKELALAMWPPDEKGNPWEYTFFLNNLRYFKIPIQYFNEISGYQFRSVQGFQEISDPHLISISKKYPILDNLFEQFKDESSVEIPKDNEKVHVNVTQDVKSEYLVNFRLKPYIESVTIPNVTRKKNGVIDFDERHRRNTITGSKGEELVMRDEKQYLISIGRPDLAEKVHRISVEDMYAGYDILSYCKDGSEKKIEVKSTTLPKGAKFGFKISANEKKVAESSNNYWIYLVFDINSSKPQIASIKNPFLLGGLLKVEPTQYKVSGIIE